MSPESASPTEKQVKNNVSGSAGTEEQEDGVGENETRAGGRKTEAAPSMKEIEVCNLHHSVFRKWCPRCVRGRAESLGCNMEKDKERGVPIVGLGYACVHSEQEKEDEKGMPIAVLKDSRAKMIMAKVVQSRQLLTTTWER